MPQAEPNRPKGKSGVIKVPYKKFRSFPVPPEGVYEVTLKAGLIVESKNANGEDRQRVNIPAHINKIVDGDELCEKWEGKDVSITLFLPHPDDEEATGDKRMYDALYYLAEEAYPSVDAETTGFDTGKLDGVSVQVRVRNYRDKADDLRAGYVFLIPSRAEVEARDEGRAAGKGSKGRGRR